MRLFRALVWALVPVLGLGPLTRADARPAPVGQDPIRPGEVYAGDFPDPSVLRIGARYYAYSTTSYGLNVPMLTSTDLRRWTARPGSATNPTGDVLPRTPVWSAGRERSDGRFTATTWAPTVTRVAPKKFVLAYSVREAGPKARMCIAIATASSASGPFTDTSTEPVLCPDRGAIDPQVFLTPTGYPWLMWKIDYYPARLYATRMTADGTGLPAGAKHWFMAGITQPWEGRIIENPAMVRFKNRFYLFYSANSYASTRYAVGYLVCRTVHGPCTKPRKTPLMATGKYVAGPGGPAPFLDTKGKLRLAYHAWRPGAVGYPSSAQCRDTALGCPQRRLYVATLEAKKDGTLRVVRWNG